MLILNLEYRLGLLVFDSGNITFNKVIKRMKGSKERPTKKRLWSAFCCFCTHTEVWWWIFLQKALSFQIFWSITKAQKTECIYVLPWDLKHVFFRPQKQRFFHFFFPLLMDALIFQQNAAAFTSTDSIQQWKHTIPHQNGHIKLLCITLFLCAPTSKSVTHRRTAIRASFDLSITNKNKF